MARPPTLRIGVTYDITRHEIDGAIRGARIIAKDLVTLRAVTPKLGFVTLSLLLLLSTVESSMTKANGQASGGAPGAWFDVIHYDAQVEPDITNKTVRGKELIRFRALKNYLDAVEIDCGGLTIEAVHEQGVALKFSSKDRRLRITLARPAKANEIREIEVSYHGAPRRGIRFFPQKPQVYTVFSTSQWLVCVDAPDDKATLRLKLVLPAGLTNVANGHLVSTRKLPNDKVVYEWLQKNPIPTYTFGFAAGRFHTVTERRGSVELRYLSAQLSDEQLRRVFRDTADMISFYEDRAGVSYADATYTQVLAEGDVEQEMSSFTALRESYGREVLADEHAVWLGAHELAHQWWGNMVTCRDWTHFWLNEGMATFMATAYKEHRFGREAYLRDIEEYRAKYQKVRDAGKDRSLVFPDWLHPSAEDRTLVYDKGAYVLHLLRTELGERAFWAGLRQYTRMYFGKSVITSDFQAIMEQASGKSLKDFFAQWVYMTRPET
ncbi:MAG TPA: M1 family metallopeptidase [Pyrinomonadaceae bacterium]|nr:M1 family metallopeptidase [Pyrinomonadaceae bacterium]